MFKIKDGYKVELQTPETITRFGSTKKIVDKTKNRKNIPTLELAEAVLAQCNLVNKQCQQKSLLKRFYWLLRLNLGIKKFNVF